MGGGIPRPNPRQNVNRGPRFEPQANKKLTEQDDNAKRMGWQKGEINKIYHDNNKGELPVIKYGGFRTTQIPMQNNIMGMS